MVVSSISLYSRRLRAEPSTARLAGQPESNDDEEATFFGVPVPTTLYGAQLRAGRWLQAEDTFALVMHQKEAAELGVGVGDWVTFDIPLKLEKDTGANSSSTILVIIERENG